jgi:dihydrofolate reductase
MAKFVFGMVQSLDGYIAGKGQTFSATTGSTEGPVLPAPGPELGRHFSDQIRGVAGMIYGATMYEIMRFWDVDHVHFDEDDCDFAAAWRSKPKWVISSSLKDVGPHATLVSGDLETFARRLKAEVDGEIDVAGAEIAASLGALGLIDEYRLYFRPFVLGGGKKYFAAVPPALRLVSSDRVGEDAVRLTCVPA